MQITEIYTDEAGDTHFRKRTVDLDVRDFAPPSAPVGVSAGEELTTGIFFEAPPGWDKSFHTTPRRQYAIMLSGRMTLTVSDGTVVDVRPGDVLLLNDLTGKGHLSQVQGDEPITWFFAGLADEAPVLR